MRYIKLKNISSDIPFAFICVFIWGPMYSVVGHVCTCVHTNGDQRTTSGAIYLFCEKRSVVSLGAHPSGWAGSIIPALGLLTWGKIQMSSLFLV